MTVLSVATVLGFYLPLEDWLRIEFPDEVEEYLRVKNLNDDDSFEYIMDLYTKATHRHSYNVFSCNKGIYDNNSDTFSDDKLRELLKTDCKDSIELRKKLFEKFEVIPDEFKNKISSYRIYHDMHDDKKAETQCFVGICLLMRNFSNLSSLNCVEINMEEFSKAKEVLETFILEHNLDVQVKLCNVTNDCHCCS